MINYKYAIYFGTWSEVELITAENPLSAAIIARSKRIRKGLHHKVSMIDIWSEPDMDYVHLMGAEEINNWN